MTTTLNILTKRAWTEMWKRSGEECESTYEEYVAKKENYQKAKNAQEIKSGYHPNCPQCKDHMNLVYEKTEDSDYSSHYLQTTQEYYCPGCKNKEFRLFKTLS